MQLDCEALFQSVKKIEQMSLTINNKYLVSFENLRLPRKFSFKTFLSNLFITFNENFENLSFKIQELLTSGFDFYFELKGLEELKNKLQQSCSLEDSIKETFKTFSSSFKLFLEEKTKLPSVDLEAEVKHINSGLINLFNKTLYSKQNSQEMHKSFLKKLSQCNLDVLLPESNLSGSNVVSGSTSKKSQAMD